MTNQLPPPRIIRTPDAARFVGLSESSLEKLRCRGDGPAFIKIGSRAVGYLVADLDAWLVSRRRSSTSERAR
ncbi:MAG: AlpA family phage regulatory protein [Candidatus Rokuibacteriota bacterium]